MEESRRGVMGDRRVSCKRRVLLPGITDKQQEKVQVCENKWESRTAGVG